MLPMRLGVLLFQMIKTGDSARRLYGDSTQAALSLALALTGELTATQDH